MARATAQALQPWRWLGAPALFALVATVVLGAPVRVFGLGLPEPVIPMCLAFAWAVIRPSLLGPVVLLLSGLFLDFFWGGPLGLWALALLAVYGIALAGRSLMAGQGAFVTGVWYGIACGLGIGVAFALSTLKAHAQPNLASVAWQFVWTAALYPLAYLLIERFEDADIRFR